MERELSDEKELSPEIINEMEERRITRLNEAGIDEEHILKRANENKNTWMSYFGENITRGKDDMNFVLRDQWTAVERSEFTRLFKPAMTFNKLYDSTKKIAGEQRKNKPDLIVRSLTGKATQEQINLRADLIRTISYQSQNDLVYQTAFKSALMMGYGSFQVCLDYESPRSFNKAIRYDLITDPTMCAWDPTAIKPHKGDGNFCSRCFVFTRDEFMATFPYITNPVSYVDPYMLLDFQWTTKDTIIVCDEFVKEWYPLIIYKVKVGNKFETMDDDQFDAAMKRFNMNMEMADGTEIKKILEKDRPTKVDQRQTQDYRIMHYRMIRDQIIDFSHWPSKQLPILFVDGDSYYIEGRQYTKSFIHEARDAQKLLNYSRSELAGELKNRRREQWIGTPDNIAGYEQDWRNPEVQVGMLRARPDPKTGMLPQKQQAWEVSQGLFMTAQSTTQDLKEILGFSESEQLQGRDISGKARRERKLEGAMSSYVFYDNLNQAIEQSGRIVNDLLPYVVGEDERHMMLSRKDGTSQSMVFNTMNEHGEKENTIDAEGYDVEIDTGPSFAVQKEMALEFFQQTIAASGDPHVFALIADLWAKNLDIQFMPQIAERLQSLVPPEIIAKEKGEQPPPPKPDPQMMMMQAEMKEKEASIHNKEMENQIKAEKLEIEKEKQQLEKAKLLLSAHKVQTDAQLNVFDHKLNLEEAKARHHLDHKKTDMDFTHKISSLLTDLHKHHNEGAKERAAAKAKS